MNTTFLYPGLACIVGAIIGGGLKAFGVELPAFQSWRRQVMLGLFGVALLIFGAAIKPDPTPVNPTPVNPAPVNPAPVNPAPAGGPVTPVVQTVPPVTTTCLAGQAWDGKKCVNLCRGNEHWNGEECVANGFPSGFVTLTCGCHGYVNPGATRPNPQCASGYDIARPCAGWCFGGGTQWGATCV